MRKLIMAAAAAFVLAQPAMAEDRQIGNWMLMDSGKGCSIWSPDETGNGITMFNDGPAADSLGFVVTGLDGVVAGQDEPLDFSINGREPIQIKGTGVVLESGASGYAFDFPLNVLTDSPLSGKVTISRKGRVIHSFLLDGVQEPAKALVACGKSKSN